VDVAVVLLDKLLPYYTALQPRRQPSLQDLIYFTLLQLIISWINICHFTNYSPDYLDMCSLLHHNTVHPVS
jgi:hypothetical protein